MAQPESRFKFKRSSVASAKAATALVVALGFATSASAQLTNGRIRQNPVSGPGFTACLSMEGAKCRLIAPAVAFAIGVENGDAVISYLDPSQAGYVVQRKESVGADLEKAAARGVYGSSQSALIFAELLSMHELMYRLPSDQNELKRLMGFPAQIVLTPEDQIGVLTSHLQLTLGVSAITADYLISKLGLSVLTDEVVPTVEQAAPEVISVAPEAAPAANEVVPPLEVQPLPSEDPNMTIEPTQAELSSGLSPKLIPELSL